MLNWKLLLINCCFWSSALVVDSATLTASQLDSSDICRFVKTSLENSLTGNQDSLYISIEYVTKKPEWKLVSKFEPLMRDFLDYCLNVPNKSKMVDICAQYTNDTLQQNNGFRETNYLNGTTSIRLLTALKLISNSLNSDNSNPLSRLDFPVQLSQVSISLSRIFLTIYLAGNPGAYSSFDWKLTAKESILCLENPISNTYCTTTILNSDSPSCNTGNHNQNDTILCKQELFLNTGSLKKGVTRISVCMSKAPKSFENEINGFILDLATDDFFDYQTHFNDLCATEMRYSSSYVAKYWKFHNCTLLRLQDERNEIHYRYNRVLIGQNVAYWHSEFLGDICHDITPDHAPSNLKCPGIRLRQSAISWIKSLLGIGLTLASLTTLLNIVLFWQFAFGRGRKENRLRPYLLNIAIIGALWGILDAVDYLMMLVGYKTFGVNSAVYDLQTSSEQYYYCCENNLWASMPNSGSYRFHSRGPMRFRGTEYSIHNPKLMIYSATNFLATYTLQACCMLTFVAIGVIQAYSLMWPFKKPTCMDKPKRNLCFLWVIAVLVSFSVTGPLVASDTPEVTLSAILFQASTLCGVVMAVLLLSIDGLLAVALTILVCHIRRSSSGAVGVGRKHTAGTRTTNDGKKTAPAPRSVIVLVTVIMASGISFISSIPMISYLLTTHRLVDNATCDYDANSQAVTFYLARTYLLGRFFLLLSPFANPILVAIRYRAVLFPPTINGPKDSVPMRPIGRLP